MDRALAHIEKIEEKRPIENADNIEMVRILGWWCIAKIDEFQVGDKCVYIEIDSLCPKEDERFAFLESKKYKVKIMKLGKKFGSPISQGLALPVMSFPELFDKDIGSDVTQDLKITYYSADDRQRKSNKVDPDAKYKRMAARHPKLAKKKWFKWLIKKQWGKDLLFILFGKNNDKPKEFPSYIVKTDETRIENIPWILESDERWVVTEKLDGTSCSYGLKKIGKNKWDFAVCSRNVRQMDRDQKTYHESNIYWELADKYNIENILKSIADTLGCDNIVLQGEGVGNVQGNPYKLEENDLYCFNLYIEGERIGTEDLKIYCEKYGLKCVPIIETDFELPHNMESMKLLADGYSVINPKVKREGFVYRSVDGSRSFKNVSREYLLRHRLEE